MYSEDILRTPVQSSSVLLNNRAILSKPNTSLSPRSYFKRSPSAEQYFRMYPVRALVSLDVGGRERVRPPMIRT